MNLEQALKSSHHLPAAPERAEILREQRQVLRRDFYGHITNLQRLGRCEREQADGLSPRQVADQEAAERALDVLKLAIDETTEQLLALDPDADEGEPKPNRAARRSQARGRAKASRA